MVKYSIVHLPGDGIGPEVTRQAIKTLRAAGDRFNFELSFTDGYIGAAAIRATGSALPEETLDACRKADAILLGAVGDPEFDMDPSAPVRPEQGLLRIRKEMGLYANLRPVQTFPLLYDKSPLKREKIENVDFIVYRELTGGIYFGEKGRKEDHAYDHCTYSRYEVERIAHDAFKAAMRRKRKLILVDKANVLETSRLWRSVVMEIGKSYPEVELDFMFVDNAAMQIILNPGAFDVVLTENMFGDILTDEASVITGSLGMLPSASLGSDIGLFEPVHGSYPQAAGKNIANPFGTILSAAMMLDHLGQQEAALAVRGAVAKAIEAEYVSGDILPDKAKSTEEIGDFVASLI